MDSPWHNLVTWYELNQRALPWRETSDPYRILISETMLQQTRVDTVIPYYNTFLQLYPTVNHLAVAPVDDVLKTWQGLGYYSRATNLMKAAMEIVERYDGQVPCQVEELQSLPGIGAYTAGAVMSIAFNQPEPAVDGNVLRVITRYAGIHEPIDKPVVKQAVSAIVKEWLLHSDPRTMTQALMELGALVCTPKKPDCRHCPIIAGCIANRDGLTDVLPVRPAKKTRKVVQVVSLWLEHEGYVLVQKRPDEGLLAGLWQLPAVESNPEERVSPQHVLSTLKSATKSATVQESSVPYHELMDTPLTRETVEREEAYMLLASERHLFTHLEWQLFVYRPVGRDEPWATLNQFGIIQVEEPYRWVQRDQLHRLAWPRVYEKVLTTMSREVLLDLV